MSAVSPIGRSGIAYGLFLILVGLLALAGGQQIRITRVDRTGDPGPRAYPAVLALVLIGGGVALVTANAIRRRHPELPILRSKTCATPAAAASGTPAADLASAYARPAPPGDPDPRELAPVIDRRRGWIIAGAIVLYAALLPWLGFALATAGFALVAVRQLRGSWAAAAGVAVVIPALVYLLFVRLFQVQLPTAGWLPF